LNSVVGDVESVGCNKREERARVDRSTRSIDLILKRGGVGRYLSCDENVVISIEKQNRHVRRVDARASYEESGARLHAHASGCIDIDRSLCKWTVSKGQCLIWKVIRTNDSNWFKGRGEAMLSHVGT